MRTLLLTTSENDHRVRLGPVTRGYELDPEALAGPTMVRRFRLADVCDRETVIKLVAALGYREGAAWLRANRHFYSGALHKVETA